MAETPTRGESFADHLSRVRQMSTDSEAWALSDEEFLNDQAALKAVLASHEALLAACKKALAHVTHEETTTTSEPTRDKMRWIAGFLRQAIDRAEGQEG